MRGLGLLLALLSLARGPGGPRSASQAAVAEVTGYQLLSNQSMEAYDGAYGYFEGVACQVATGWNRFWYDGPEPYWMDTRVFAESHLGDGHVERIVQETSQMVLSTEPYTAGLWQRVSGLTPGNPYGFHAAMITIYLSSAYPRTDGTMIKQVGIDPSGGTDPQSPAVVWSEADSRDKRWAIGLNTAAYALGDTVTVFIRVISPYPAGSLPYLNQSFLDSAILAQTGRVSAMSPRFSSETSFVVRWDNLVPAPECEVRCYDAQWMDQAEGVWHDLSKCSLGSPSIVLQKVFSGQQGHTYRFRARVWQRYPNGAHLASPYNAEGDTWTHVGEPHRSYLPFAGKVP